MKLFIITKHGGGGSGWSKFVMLGGSIEAMELFLKTKDNGSEWWLSSIEEVKLDDKKPILVDEWENPNYEG